MGKPARTFKVGDRVHFLTQYAHLHDDCHWGAKLAVPRSGTIVKVPDFANRTGGGTLLIHWDALVGSNEDKALWQKWTHSDHVELGEAAQ